MHQSFIPHWREGPVEKPCIGRQEVGKPDQSRVWMSSSMVLSLGGGLRTGAESGVLRSDSKEAVRPVLALVRDLANPESFITPVARNEQTKKTHPEYKEKSLVSKRNGTIYCQ